MDFTKILELLSYTIPAVVTGLVALHFFKVHAANEDKRRSFLLRKEGSSIALPLRLQAYERLTLFLERITPSKLLVRVHPKGKDVQQYARELTGIVEQEYEHNLAQQIYVSETAWKSVVTAKNLIVKIIRTSAENDELQDAESLRQDILQRYMSADSPTAAAIALLRIEVKKLF